MDSERIRSAKSTPKNGCMLLKIVARGGADPVDGREPEDVREEERPDHGVGEAEPDRPREGEVLAAELRDAHQGERHPAEREHDRADPVRRVAAHQRRDRDRVARPGDGERDREQVALPARDEPAAGAGRDQRDAGERQAGADPERPAAGRACRKTIEISPTNIGHRAEEQRHRRGVRELEAVDEAELVHEDHRRRRCRRRSSRRARSGTSARATRCRSRRSRSRRSSGSWRTRAEATRAPACTS